MNKPKYQVPTIESLRSLSLNGFRVISTFSGGGGSCLGFRFAGYEIAAASEFIASARDTYLANFPDTKIDPSDIRDIRGDDLLRLADAERFEIDVLEGSPPCAPFSTLGNRDKSWGQVNSYSDGEQRSDDLFFEFARIVDDIRPKVFVAENVKGLVSGTAKGYFKMILGRLRAIGYRVEARLLDASLLGVPQKRQRVIFIGVRNDLGLAPVFPKPLPYTYSLFDALGKNLAVPEDCGSIDPETQHDISLHRYAVGEAWHSTQVCAHSRRYFQLTKPDPNKPHPTVVASIGMVGGANPKHPFVCRNWNLREIRRLCSFPDDFQLVGSFEQRGERLGRSVPPLMMKAVADTIRDEILAKL